jgi:hypothetical protein
MRRLLPTLVLVAAAAAGGCATSRQLAEAPPEKTVLKVDNQGFADMNIYVLPEASNRVRLGTVTGTTSAYFTLPNYLVRSARELRFQALPIATPRGPLSQSIVVSPGDPVGLTIPAT